MTRGEFRGVWVAMVTPWNHEKKAPEHAVLRKLVDRFAVAGVTGLYVLGTTGEGTLLSQEKRKAFAEAVIELTEGKLPVIVHTGHDRTEVACGLSRHAQKIGAAAVAVAPPCRYRFTQDELHAHYSEIASTIGDLPLFLYDIPATTGNPLNAEFLSVLHASYPNVIGAKVSRGDWEAWEGYTAIADEFIFLIGKDEMALPLLAMGGSGLVASGANIFPELYVALYRAAMRGDYVKGNQLQLLITELCRVTRRGHVPTIKRALSLAGLEVDPPIAPLRPVSPAGDTALSTQLASIRDKATQMLKKGGGSKEQA